ncbi:MAG: thioesterase family protein [Candidatus Methylomirabilia bacterium]
MDLRPGAVAEVDVIVTPERTADAMGNKGVMVFATPFLIGLLEDAAGAIIHPHLPPGAATVGTWMEMRHLAATPVGMRVRARAELTETDGKRFRFRVEASDEVEKVAQGTHERLVVASLEKFLSRAMAKGT